MSKASRDKGARYERRQAAYLTARGISAERRLEQWRSGGDDLILPPAYSEWLSVECKDVAASSVGAWLDQAIGSAGPARTGVVFHHRRGNADPALDLATFRVDQAVGLILAVQEARS